MEIFASREPDEVILRFPSEEAYDAFLFALAGSKIHLVDQLDRLRAIRLGYDEWADLSNLLDGENIVAYDSLPAVPAPSPAGGADQAGLVGFGDGLAAVARHHHGQFALGSRGENRGARYRHRPAFRVAGAFPIHRDHSVSAGS